MLIYAIKRNALPQHSIHTDSDAVKWALVNSNNVLAFGLVKDPSEDMIWTKEKGQKYPIRCQPHTRDVPVRYQGK